MQNKATGHQCINCHVSSWCLQRPPGVRLHAVGHRRQALHELRGRPRRERDQLRQLQVQVTAEPLDVQKKNPADPCGARRERHG